MDFYKRIGVVCNAIPTGKAATYGQIALLCGKPRNARQVGFALKTGKAGEVPAHRVVNSKGELSGAEYFLLRDLQRDLLAAEGVVVLYNGTHWQVDLKEYGWKTEGSDQQFFARRFAELDI